MEESGIFHDIPPEHHFWARNGTIIKSLHELQSAIEQMDDVTFMHHVNSEKNDFSEWVRSVLKDKKLADNMSKTTSKKSTVKVIEKRIAEMQKKKAKAEKKAKKKVVRKAVKKTQGEEQENKDTKKSVSSVAHQSLSTSKPMEFQEKEKANKIGVPMEKIEEILEKEKMIEKKEEKIREIEEKIEKRLEEMKKPRTTKFFSKEFVQGILVGILLVALGILVYIKFFAI